ncbi:cobalamin biosynthesis protein [Streptomyces sp. NA02950]|nr:cobalamin biosynthesis protein [Streptomyces sp. NA02950]
MPRTSMCTGPRSRAWQPVLSADASRMCPTPGDLTGRAEVEPVAPPEPAAPPESVEPVAPPEVVVGVGASRGVSAGEVAGLVESVLAAEGLSPGRIAELATVEARAAEPGLLEAAARLGVPLRAYPASALATVEVPTPSATTLAAVGTPGVAESAALLAAGPGAELLVRKRKSSPRGRAARVTCAVARRRPAPEAAPVRGGAPGRAATLRLDGAGREGERSMDTGPAQRGNLTDATPGRRATTPAQDVAPLGGGPAQRAADRRDSTPLPGGTSARGGQRRPAVARGGIRQ